MRAFVASIKLVAFLITLLVFFLPIVLAYSMRQPVLVGLLLRGFYTLACACWDIRVQVSGELVKQRPLLLVSNHCSYLDVPVLGRMIEVRFTPKHDVRGWPIIGFLCQMAGCIFINRQRSKTKENQAQLQQEIEKGAVISVFPEGTTNDGFSVQNFRSSYFSLAEMELESPLLVQPVMVSYFHPDGTMLSREEMDDVAWYGDDEFVTHLWRYLRTKGVRAEVTFHEPVTKAAFENRKELAAYCEEKIVASFDEQQKKAPRRALSNNGG